MRLLVIPDIHTAWKRAEEAIVSLAGRYDNILCGGDYFDDFGATQEDQVNTAKWLKSKIGASGITCLMGNHDAPYAYPEAHSLMCSGHQLAHREAIYTHTPPNVLDTLKLFAVIDNVFYSHAGLSKTYVNRRASLASRDAIIAWITSQAIEAKDAIKHNRPCELLQAGYARGGSYPCGGLIWCDFNDEMVPIARLKQVCFHTIHNRPAEISPKGFSYRIEDKFPLRLGTALDLDTKLRTVAIVTDGKLVELFDATKLKTYMAT